MLGKTANYKLKIVIKKLNLSKKTISATADNIEVRNKNNYNKE
jgi:hypothetical protein